MLKKYLICLVALLFSGILYASELLETPSSFFIVHTSTQYDPLKVTQEGLLRSIEVLKPKGVTIFSLHNDKTPQYFDESLADVAVYSKSGEHNFVVKSRNYFFAGGYFEACFHWAVSDVFQNFANQQGIETLEDTTNLYFITDAIFSVFNDKVTLAEMISEGTSPTSFLKIWFYRNDGLDKDLYINSFSDNIIFKSETFTFKFFYEGQLVFQKGSGPKLINIFLVRSSQLNQIEL